MRVVARVLWFSTCLLVLTANARCADRVRAVLQLGHTDNVTAIAFSPDGRYLATGSKDDTIILWEAAPGTVVWRFGSEAHSPENDVLGGVHSLAFSPDGHRLLVGAEGAGLWDVPSGRGFNTIPGMTVSNRWRFLPTGDSGWRHNIPTR
jgi:WD40 repeat protein